MIALEDLIAEAEALARPCMILSRTTGKRLGGYLGGIRSDIPPIVAAGGLTLSQEHLFTIDPTIFAEIDLAAPKAPLSVCFIEDMPEADEHTIFSDGAKSFASLRFSGIPLYAVQSRSFPPIEALCLHGGERVAQWLGALGLARHEYDAAQAEAVGRAYVREYVARAPFYQRGTDIIVGGWQMRWPDDEVFAPQEMRMLVTSWGDEPFVEVWASASGDLSVRSHVT